MVQTLLADRFKLAVHRETRESDVYRLIVEKGGLKLKDANGGRRNLLNWTGPGQVTFTEMTSLVSLTAILGSILGVPVLDETGITVRTITASRSPLPNSRNRTPGRTYSLLYKSNSGCNCRLRRGRSILY